MSAGRYKRRSPAAERIREQALADARQRFPDADHIRVNPAHVDGPVIEVTTKGWTETYRWWE